MDIDQEPKTVAGRDAGEGAPRVKAAPLLEILSSLHWYRLRAMLVNVRFAAMAAAHPFSVMQAIVKGVSASIAEVPEQTSEVLFHIVDWKHTRKTMQEGAELPLEFFFFGESPVFAEKWRDAFGAYLEDPETGKNFSLLSLGEVERRTYEALVTEQPSLAGAREICLEFLTPMFFKPEARKRKTWLTTERFIEGMERRFSRLFGVPIVLGEERSSVELLPYFWNYVEIRHASRSQPGQWQYINGAAGRLYIKGDIPRFWPLLLLGSELHAGSKLSNSQGYYRILPESPGWFSRFFPSSAGLRAALGEVLEEYDTAAEELAKTEMHPFDEAAFAEKLCGELKSGEYMPGPQTAFALKKKSGGERVVERLTFRDLVVQKYVLRIIEDVFDRFFEEGSIGFRKGIPRSRAVEAVKQAVRDGYRFLIESDIEDFFPSIRHEVLFPLLDRYLPTADECMRRTLRRCIAAGYVRDGQAHERQSGVAQGAPLSPMMANLYLDGFDEQAADWNVRMLRYSDDFIVMARTREEAEHVLGEAEGCLAEVGLRLNKEKTAIRSIDDGFRFLGYDFDKGELRDSSDDEWRPFRKPLYLTEPYLYLAVNGDAFEIRKDKLIIATMPVRRVSELIMMERALLSSAVVKKCMDFGISITMTLNSGYHITTIKPDSKKFYGICFEHGRWFAGLTDTELLCFAKEFAAGKIANHISFFKQRYVAGMNIFIRHLERTIDRIYSAASVEQVRGSEGAAATKVYDRINTLIDDPVFHMKKRVRIKPDRINSLFNFGYYLLFSRINATVRAQGLNPYLGFLHSAGDNYESLVCDIEELFRSHIDRFIVRLLNLKIIDADDFFENDRGWRLTQGGTKKFIEQFEIEMDRKGGRGTLSLKEQIYIQIDILRQAVVDGKPLTFYRWESDENRDL